MMWLEEDGVDMHNAITLIKEASERYAPNVNPHAQTATGDQWNKIAAELDELHDAMCFDNKGDPAKECADVIIAAVRLGTMLSEDFAQVILDKCKELDAREPLL